MKINVLLLTLLTVSPIYASGILKNSASPNEPTIHTITVSNPGDKSIPAKITILAGKMLADFCYTGPSDANPYNFGPRSKTIIYLDGNALKERFNTHDGRFDGGYYDCGVVVFETDKSSIRDVFYLYHDDKTYNKTDPDTYEIQI